jgi:ATP-dependent protease ClpP protease subunit
MKTIDVFGAIGDEWDGATDAQIAAQLEGYSGPLTVRLNSPGGLAHHGVAIYNLLKPFEPTIEVIGMAASAASIILMAGKNRIVATGANVMIHDPWGIQMGNARDMEEYGAYLRTVGRSLATIYAKHAKPDHDWSADMAKTTWYTAEEAVAAGLADAQDERDAESPTDDAALTLAALGCSPPSSLLMCKPSEAAVQAARSRLSRSVLKQTRLRTAPLV